MSEFCVCLVACMCMNHNEDLFTGQWTIVELNIISDMIIILKLTSPLNELNLFFCMHAMVWQCVV